MNDCIIVGAGPAGLTAGIYMGRFLRRALILDGGKPRAAFIPRTRNLAGFPQGITGPDLLARMREQATAYGVELRAEVAQDVQRCDGGFRVVTESGEHLGRTLVLATGVTNHPPRMDIAEHDAAVARGLIRYCPICDAFEVQKCRVAVLGTGAHGVAEAVFLRRYSADVTLVRPDAAELNEADRRRLESAGISLLPSHMQALNIDGDKIAVTDAEDGRTRFDTLYTALGTTANATLARKMEMQCGADNCIEVDARFQTSVDGAYAIGDVITGLDQISFAMGQASVVATAIHNRLDG